MTAPKRKDGVVNLEALVAEAEKESKGSFKLQVTVDEVIEIPEPSGEEMLVVEEVSRTGTSRDLIRTLCGDQYDAVIGVVGPKNHRVLSSLGTKMQEHFGLGE